MRKLCTLGLILWSGNALAETTQDHYKNVIIKKPYTVEVCTQGNGKSD